MINNGYINSNSISFTAKNTYSIFRSKDSDDRYMLFQFDPNYPHLKHIMINGDIQFPPIKYKEKENEISLKEDIAVVGKKAKKSDVPPGIKVIGHFDTPNSYKLNLDVWVLSGSDKISPKNGEYFIFSTPKQNIESVFNKHIKTDSIKIISRDDYGTYTLESNKLIKISLYMSIVFLLAIFIFIGANWLAEDKNMVNILFISGKSIPSVYFFIWKWKILPYGISSLLSVLIAVIFCSHLSRLWSDTWLINATLISVFFFIYLCVFCLFTISFYTVGRGGKRI